MTVGVAVWCIWLALSPSDISTVQAVVGLLMSVFAMGLSLWAVAT